MADIYLPIIPGTLPPGICFSGPNAEQNRLVAFAENMQALLSGGQSFYNYGPTVPTPENRIYPWLNTNDGRWYQYSGGWISPVNYDANERRWFAGSLVALQTYDGGDALAPSDRSGPMWVEDEDFRGRSPMHPGDIPTANPAKTLALGENFGEGAHTQTEAEMATHDHVVHAFGEGGSLTDIQAGDNLVAGVGEIERNTDETGDGEAMPIIHPVRGLYCVKWSGRLFRFIAG